MGKNRVIKSLGRCIGNVVMHKFLLIHTNKPESKGHLNSEIAEYGSDAFEKAQEFNWNDQERHDIKEKANERIKLLMKNYPDVLYNQEEIERLIEETIKELLI